VVRIGGGVRAGARAGEEPAVGHEGHAHAHVARIGEAAFIVLHDYDRRLDWDTLLSEAYLCNGAAAAGTGVVSVCCGRWTVGGFPMRTQYVSFDRPSVAAVRLMEPIAFFEKWAASIRHQNVEPGSSTITYVYSFAVRPKWLAWLLEPIVDRVFRWETRRRLDALGRYLQRA